MKITWYGTATVGIDDGETKLLFDPFVRMNRRIPTTPLEGFAGFDAIFVTHGHFDHIYSIPALLKIDGDVRVYCTETPKNTLVGKGAPADRIDVIKPGDELRVGNFTVKVWKFRHIVFDPVYILTVAPKCTVFFPKLFWQTYTNKKFPSKGEIVAYEIEGGGKRVFLTGSFRDTPEIEYPKNADLLVLANGGSIFVPEKTAGFIAKYTPKAILVDHFDNAFPPVTRNLDLTRLKKRVQRDHPEIRFIIPEAGKELEL
ncbi:MAG: MBL fold metallo-hydrolase [Clostridia bacterium]|nr:MBL fold metallo-hydrolase [Clostridia bacterium]